MKAKSFFKPALLCVCACFMLVACGEDAACLKTLTGMKYLQVSLTATKAAQSCGEACGARGFSVFASNRGSDGTLLPITWKSATEFEINGTVLGNNGYADVTIDTSITGTLDASLKTIKEISVTTKWEGDSGYFQDNAFTATDVPLDDADCEASPAKIMYWINSAQELQGHVTSVQWNMCCVNGQPCECTTIDYAQSAFMQVWFMQDYQ
jgi:hypothetical protein